jgi:16S rRNA (guanine527-N7)-methyltransferase
VTRQQDNLASNVSRETIAVALSDLKLPSSCIDQLVEHWRLIQEWNQRTNLTAIRETSEAAWIHYRDSLEALSLLPPGSVTDIGSGAGFPGIPIAAAHPDRSVTLVEPRRKRASFLSVAVARLGLNNTKILTMRAEDQPPVRSNAVVTRATFSNPTEIQRCLSWVAPGGVLIAFRSEPGDLRADTIHWYHLRGDRRCLLLYQNSD